MSILAIVLAVLAIVYSGHVAIVYQRFNDQIKSWSENIDASTKDAIERSARQILRELDEKITEEKQKENVESLNNNENE